MFITAIVAIAITALAGWIVKSYFDRREVPESYISRAQPKISLAEYSVGLVVLGLIVAPSVLMVGNRLSVASTLSYQEFYNGYETHALRHETICEPGEAGNSESSGRSNCAWEYKTDETYTWLDLQSYPCTDANGDASTCQHWVPVTDHIYYPYAKVEYTYQILDSLGGNHRFKTVYIPQDAEPYAGEPIPDHIPRGEPEEWTISAQRLAAGYARSVTRIFWYDNFILAAKDELLLPFSQDIERYLEAGILPEHTADIMTRPLRGFNESFAHKMSFVGVATDEPAWQESVMDFNAVLGSELRGDLHMVAIDADLVDDPDNYLNALKAYWLGEDFGRRAIAKNAIIVVLGVDNGTVQWAKATTGMPYGNEAMILAIENFLYGVPFTPQAVIGMPRIEVIPGPDGEHEATFHLALEPGELERIVLQDFPFKRACMTCEDDGDEGIGFDKIVAKIPPPPSHLFVMGLVVFIISMAAWVFLAYSDMIDRFILSRRPTVGNRYEFNPPPMKYRNR